ncbi:MAG: hypothetical protein HYR91_02640 [Flavobacteriia bacterium]|nr:hypothetical protein [Flavobacteriia bacterium]
MTREFRLWNNIGSILGIVLLLYFTSFSSFSQISSLREKTIYHASDTIYLDSLTLYPNSLEVFCIQNNEKIYWNKAEYEINLSKNILILFSKCSDSIHLKYRVLPISLHKKYQTRDTSQIYTSSKGNRDDFIIKDQLTTSDIFGNTGINKSGSISRGISFGNNQNLAVNSSLNLELSGDIAPNLKILASVSDDNLPLQADGNTNKLQEFDQVFIQIYNDSFKLIAGDFWLKKPEGYFLNYKKRAQGLSTEYSWGRDSNHVWKTQLSTALSKGRFNRQIIPGIEGNQGPYKLTGIENEPFIIILSGTENVYIDGRLLTRGQEFDYTINYNTAELIFTSRNQITKDSRIVVEFQYTAQNYARSLVQNSTSYSSKKLKYWFNIYSEQDAKNQPLQQQLSINQKQLLASIGDHLNEAQTSSIDSIGYLDNQNLYALKDSLGFDSVLVFSVNPDSALYKATFQYVGQGNGDYTFSYYGAFGKIYKWVKPVAGVSQGNYAPSKLIYTPQQKRMISTGFAYQISPKIKVETEFATSKNDLNTFSSLDSKDDNGIAIKSKFSGKIPLNEKLSKKWELESKFEIETLDKNFIPIEQYRAVEFDRDWNTRNKGYLGNQMANTIGINLKNTKKGNITLEGQQYIIGTDYQGLKIKTTGKWSHKNLNSIWEGSVLNSNSVSKNQYIRHKIDINKKIKKIKIGFKDDHEFNTFQKTSTLDLSSYQFYDYQIYISNEDSSKNNFTFFYRERFDQKSDSFHLTPVASAKTAGGKFDILSLKNQKINIVTSYRELKISNTSFINQTPENTLLGRIQYEIKAFNGAISFNNFYEIGSGLELKREFVYIKVNDGQGIYTWIDYNNDGIKDVNEFEIAQFIDQASYVRIFSPSNVYIKTYSNELNQGLFIKPERVFTKNKWSYKIISKFSDQARVRINKKTTYFNGKESLNPYSSVMNDNQLLSTTSNIKNTIYFNRNSSVFSCEFSNQDTRSKTLLANGFDSKQNTFKEISIRINVKKMFTLESSFQSGIKISKVEYTTGRDYYLHYYYFKPSIIFQPSTSLRITLDLRKSQKINSITLGGDSSIVYQIGSSFKYNQAEKGSFQGSFNIIKINFSGNQNSALGFEMLEALKPGENYVWNLSYQRSISQKLQISFQYNGRKSIGNRTVHSGGMEVRAFF